MHPLLGYTIHDVDDLLQLRMIVTSPSVRFKQPHPAVWITKHATARIVGITLGHDERVRDLPAFKTLLVSAVRWGASVTANR